MADAADIFMADFGLDLDAAAAAGRDFVLPDGMVPLIALAWRGLAAEHRRLRGERDRAVLERGAAEARLADQAREIAAIRDEMEVLRAEVCGFRADPGAAIRQAREAQVLRFPVVPGRVVPVPISSPNPGGAPCA